MKYTRGPRIFTGITIVIPSKNSSNTTGSLAGTDSTYECDDDVSILSASEDNDDTLEDEEDELYRKSIQQQQQQQQTKKQPACYTPKPHAESLRTPSQSPRAPSQSPRAPSQSPRAPSQFPRAPAQSPRAPAQSPRAPSELGAKASESENQRPSERGNAWNDLVSQWEALHTPKRSTSAHKSTYFGSADPKDISSRRINTRRTSLSSAGRANSRNTLQNISPGPDFKPPSSAGGPKRPTTPSTRSSTTAHIDKEVIVDKQVIQSTNTPNNRAQSFTKQRETPSSAPKQRTASFTKRTTPPRIPLSSNSKSSLCSSNKWALLSAGFSCVKVQPVSCPEHASG